MRIRTWIVCVCLAAMGTTVVAQNITHDFDKAADFSRLKTYTWVRGNDLADELNHRRIVNAVDAQLAAKGLARVADDANPDVLVAYHASFNRDLQISAWGWGGYRFGPNRSGSARVEEIVIGTMAVDVVDARTRTIIWRGIASKEIDVNASPDKRERNINKAAEKLFKSFPPAQ